MHSPFSMGHSNCYKIGLHGPSVGGIPDGLQTCIFQQETYFCPRADCSSLVHQPANLPVRPRRRAVSGAVVEGHTNGVNGHLPLVAGLQKPNIV